MRQGESDLCRCVIPVFHPRWPPANWLGSDWGGPHRLPRGGAGSRSIPAIILTQGHSPQPTLHAPVQSQSHMLCSHSTPNYTQHTTSSSHLGVKVPVLRSLGPSHRHRAMLGPAFPPQVIQPSFFLLCFHYSRRCGETHGRRAVGPSPLCVEVRIVRGVPDVGSR